MARWSSFRLSKTLEVDQRALELDPGSPSGYNGLGLTHEAQGHYADALEAYQHALELCSTNRARVQVLRNLGDVHRRMADYEQALAMYQRADALNLGVDGTLLSALAAVYLKLGCNVEYAEQITKAREVIANEIASLSMV